MFYLVFLMHTSERGALLPHMWLRSHVCRRKKEMEKWPSTTEIALEMEFQLQILFLAIE